MTVLFASIPQEVQGVKNFLKSVTMIAITLLVTSTIAEMHPDRVAQVKIIDTTPGVLWKTAKQGRFVEQAPGAMVPLLGVKNHKAMVAEVRWKYALRLAVFGHHRKLPVST